MAAHSIGQSHSQVLGGVVVGNRLHFSMCSVAQLCLILCLLWKGSPERAPEVSKVSGNNLELALLLPVPLSLESALGPEDPNSHHHAWSLLAAMAPW